MPHPPRRRAATAATVAPPVVVPTAAGNAEALGEQAVAEAAVRLAEQHGHAGCRGDGTAAASIAEPAIGLPESRPPRHR